MSKNTSNNIIKLPGLSDVREVVDMMQSIAREHPNRMVILDHARMRMIERGITDIQVFRVVASGHPVDGIRWDANKEKGWKCTFRRIAAGIEIDVAVKLVERDDEFSNLIVTVF